ncbi:hypothetical protein Brsp06_02098 [Brucella sp. NBRC 13694]|uniref:hypothetical protein n=1 Tax=Brucella TaxID=234 RepID=UPI00056875C2|nr:hypothetical protein [Brucella anthropi]KAB2757960.1 hypothetical protein F9K81_11440 [Brucella anthropi]MBA8861729.1 hypothetical protein [Brucella anthropi]
MKTLAIVAVGAFMVSGTAFASAPAVSTVKQTIKQAPASGPVVAGGSGKQNRVGLPGTGKSFRF